MAKKTELEKIQAFEQIINRLYEIFYDQYNLPFSTIKEVIVLELNKLNFGRHECANFLEISERNVYDIRKNAIKLLQN